MKTNKMKLMVILCTIAVISIVYSISTVRKRSIGFKQIELSELTNKEWLEEYRYIWRYLDNNSLVLNSFENSGYNLELLYKDYETKIGQCKNNTEYYICLNNFIKEFNGFAHLSLLDYNFFKYNLEVYTNIESRAWTKILTNDSVNNNYEVWNSIINSVDYKEDNGSVKKQYLTKNSETSNKPYTKTDNAKNNDVIQEKDIRKILDQYHIVLDDVGISSVNVSNIDTYNDKGISVYVSETGNIITMTIESSKIAYVKINSFAREYVEPDKKVLYEFYNQIKEYEDLIVDISENTGGSSYYWYTNIVMPNLKKDLAHTDYILYKITEDNKDFILEIMTESDELLEIDNLDNNIDTSCIPANILRSANYFI